MLEQTGIAVVTGSGFIQKPGTYHFRIALLPPEEDIVRVGKQIAKFHTDLLAKYK